MNYTYEAMLALIQQNKNPYTLQFYKPERYSAYLELAFDCINETTIEEGQKVPVNPYYRYHEIFKEMFVNEEYEPLKQQIFDILLHMNFQVDRYAGMNKHAFYILFMEAACEKGYYGETVKNIWKHLLREEKRKIAEKLLLQYKTGSSVANYKDMIVMFFEKGSVYENRYKQNELLVYTAVKKNNRKIKILEILEELFLPIQYETQIYWKNHFGIISVDETMELDRIELY